MKKIWPLLLLLLLLIFFCTLQKMDKITIAAQSVKKDATVVTIPLEEHAIEYLIQQTPDGYTLSGNFTDTLQQTELTTAFETLSSKLTQGNTSTNKTLLEKGSIALTKEIIPHFVKEYQKGKIQYVNEVLIVEGEVNNYEAKHQMQKFLAASHLASKNNTKVVLPKMPIDFLIRHTEQRNILSGHFTDNTQEEQIQNAFGSVNMPVTASMLTENPKLVDFGAISLVEKLIPSFTRNYTQGEISYRDKILTVKGKVKNKTAITEMDKLLSSANIPTKNLTTIDNEYLQRIADTKRAQEEAKLAQENRKLQEEKERLEQEAAQKARLEEEKKREEAQKARLEEEKRRAEAERERAAQEEQARLAREASAKKAAQEKEAKTNIIKLLKVENIEFNTAKSTLTNRGQSTVDKLAVILKKYPEVKVEIAGYTDSDGDALFNQKLSQARVETVKKELISQGVENKRLTAKGYGESNPLVPNTTNENKQKNRRVEINIIGE